MAAFVVGIDLGTTNSALAWVPAEGGVPATMTIPQVIAPGQVAARVLLPSFLYAPGQHEPRGEAVGVGWDASPAWVAGEYARARGAEVPERLVASAKSWLCHGGVDRHAAILPWRAVAGDPWGAPAEGGGDVQRLSPVDAAARYLAHLRGAWDHAHPGEPLAAQDVLVAVPASFDAVARELTVEAARAAGLPAITLIEEPQAALYSWLAQRGDAWRKHLRAGDVVLVCDVGGGTTDFTLVAVTDRDGALELERVAVGDHILLGGDNMDLALAHRVSEKLAARGAKLDAWQQRGLTQSCRAAKEQLLGGAVDKAPVVVLGRGSRVIGGTLRTDLELAEVASALLDGFFPPCGAGDHPEKRRAAGLRELGLPYAADPAITRHLAGFLARHGRTPTAILWNGGVMKGALLRRRLGEVVATWLASGLGNGTGGELRALEGTDLDLAVAHGAAYYGLVRRGKGVRIRGGVARSYYVGVEKAMPAVPGLRPPVDAVCLVPFGTEEGSELELGGRELALYVGEPAEFRFLCSSARAEDAPGAVLCDWQGELDELAPIVTTLPTGGGEAEGSVVPVTLRAHVTAVGTLELWCVGRDGRRWRLEFDVREQAP